MFRAVTRCFLPLVSQTRECWIGRYTDKIVIKIPVYQSEEYKNPIFTVDKDYITIVCNEIDGSKQRLQSSGDNRINSSSDGTGL